VDAQHTICGCYCNFSITRLDGTNHCRGQYNVWPLSAQNPALGPAPPSRLPQLRADTEQDLLTPSLMTSLQNRCAKADQRTCHAITIFICHTQYNAFCIDEANVTKGDEAVRKKKNLGSVGFCVRNTKESI